MMRLFTLPSCQQCNATKRSLSNKGLEFEVVDMSLDDDAADMVRGLGYQQAPVVLTDSGQHWSGFRPDLIAAL